MFTVSSLLHMLALLQLINSSSKIKLKGMKKGQFYQQEEELLINKLIEADVSRISDSFNAEKLSRQDKQVSMSTFANEITFSPNHLENTIEKAINERTSSIGKQVIDQLKSHHSVNISSNRQQSSQQTKTNEIPQSTALPIQKPIALKPNLQKAILQGIEMRKKYQKEMQERKKEFYAQLRKQIISHNMAQMKYLEDKRQERRKEREARQSQIGFMQTIMQLFNFSKQGKKNTK